jgi:hypothetical protein
MSHKKIVAYCGFNPDTRNGYIKWDREYLGMTDSEKLEFVTDTINELIREHQFLVRVVNNLRTSSAGQGLAQ